LAHGRYVGKSSPECVLVMLQMPLRRRLRNKTLPTMRRSRDSSFRCILLVGSNSPPISPRANPVIGRTARTVATS
ncbi:hypothetical protein KCU86_g22, partial [Aureobasidium melanogenum]